MKKLFFPRKIVDKNDMIAALVYEFTVAYVSRLQ